MAEEAPHETAAAPVDEAVEHVETHAAPEHHAQVSRDEFDSLKSTLDGLIAKVDHIAPPATERDQTPTKRPWTHMGSRR